MKRNLGLVAFIPLCILLTGVSCREKGSSSLPVVQLKAKGHEIEAEVASKPAAQMTGLMFRKSMPKDHGMLFVFPDSAPRMFWMKNTLIPLSIAFMDEKGKILNVLEMPPLTENTFPSNGPAKFALEMNTGWFERNGCGAGEVVEGVLQAPPAEP